MKNENHGGPAFPGEYVSERINGKPSSWKYFPGMTLRDYFAGQAIREATIPSDVLLGLFKATDPAEVEARLLQEVKNIAKWSYRMADAMLAERGKR